MKKIKKNNKSSSKPQSVSLNSFPNSKKLTTVSLSQKEEYSSVSWRETDANLFWNTTYMTASLSVILSQSSKMKRDTLLFPKETPPNHTITLLNNELLAELHQISLALSSTVSLKRASIEEANNIRWTKEQKEQLLYNMKLTSLVWGGLVKWQLIYQFLVSKLTVKV